MIIRFFFPLVSLPVLVSAALAYSSQSTNSKNFHIDGVYDDDYPDEAQTNLVAVDSRPLNGYSYRQHQKAIDKSENKRKLLEKEFAEQRKKQLQKLQRSALGNGMQPVVTEEFDVDLNAEKESGASEAANGEAVTREEILRKKHGEVEKVKPSTANNGRRTARKNADGSVTYTYDAPALSSSSTPSQQPMLSQGKRAELSLAAAMTKTHETPQDRMQAQCMAFANYLKGQAVNGPELVKMWKGTCDPAVMSGKASPGYSMLCSAVVGAVSPFVPEPNWDPNKLCTEVVRVWTEGGE